LIIHACSNTDLRKFDLCKFSSAFLVFQCGVSGRTGGPDGDGAHMSGQDLTDSGRALSSSSERSLYIVRTRATILLLSEAASVRTSSIHCPDGDPTEAIKTPARRISLYPTKSYLLAACELFVFVSFWLLVFLSYLRNFSSLFLFSFFLTVRMLFLI
jgi:hypothetical protein